VVDEQGHRTAVIVPIDTYEALLEAAEDLEDLRAADEARAAGGEPVPLEVAEARLQSEGRLQ
jgi:PHD/YefM family antitoxin component YafN of YafNO toxin-antitoxin module